MAETSDEKCVLDALERFRPRLRALLVRFRIPWQDGEDLAQDVAIIALSAGGASDCLEAWLLGVASNLCRLYWRKRLRREEPPLDSIPEPTFDPDENHRVRLIDLDRGLKGLPPRQEEALRLVAAGYPSEEVAARVGYAATGIRKLIQRNVARLTRRQGAAGREAQGVRLRR